jgi:small-conductance mechanosensitive channel
MQMPSRRKEQVRRVFETRSHAWADVGLARQLSRAAVKRARIETILLIPLIVGILVVYAHRRQLFPGFGTQVQAVTVVALLAVGWAFARSVGRVLGPALFRRLDPATAGTVGFLIRLVTIIVALLIALRIAGLRPRELAVGGAFTAVILGLAAQQTLGNLFAGMVLLSARPFKVGERVRFQAGALAGNVEGTVSALGLLYTVLSDGEDEIMIPNSVVLNVAVVPLREPDAVDLRARLRPGVTPADVQHLLEERLETDLLERPRITLEELDGDEVVVRIQAQPRLSVDGPKLASEVLAAVATETRRAAPEPPGDEPARAGTGAANGTTDGSG